MHKLAVDVDGVIANFVDSMLPHMNAFFESNFKREDIVCFDFHKAFGMPEEDFNRFWAYMKQNGLWGSIAPMPGAAKQLQLLSQALDLEYITSRPAELQNTTLSWLDRHGFPEKSITMVKNKKDIIDEFDYFIDDRLEDCIGLAEIESVRRILLFDAPWNQCSELPEKIIRVKTWSEIDPDLFQ